MIIATCLMFEVSLNRPSLMLGAGRVRLCIESTSYDYDIGGTKRVGKSVIIHNEISHCLTYPLE